MTKEYIHDLRSSNLSTTVPPIFFFLAQFFSDYSESCFVVIIWFGTHRRAENGSKKKRREHKIPQICEFPPGLFAPSLLLLVTSPIYPLVVGNKRTTTAGLEPAISWLRNACILDRHKSKSDALTIRLGGHYNCLGHRAQDPKQISLPGQNSPHSPSDLD